MVPEFPTWPIHDERELSGLQRALEGGVWSAADGPLACEFERRFADAHRARHGIAVTNGTESLVIALAAHGIGSGHEVIVPPYTFVATATAVLRVNALPVFADIDPGHYCLDPDAVEAAISERTRAIICVHFAGHPADLDRLRDIARRHDLALIEDAAHAHGAAWSDGPVGAIGSFGSWSFQASKNMTAGEGGMLTTDDDELADRARELRNCGRRVGGAWYEHFAPAGNHRLTEFQSAILLAQLERLPEQLARREANAAYLDEQLGKVDGIRPMVRDERVAAHSHHLYLFRYDTDRFGGRPRADLIEVLQSAGIPASSGYPFPLHRQPLFLELTFDQVATGYDRDRPSIRYAELDLPASERACRESVWLPHNVLLGSEDTMGFIVETVRGFRDRSAA